MSNEKQITYWNEVAGPKWVKIDDKMEARFIEINRLALHLAAAQPGELILDIGCGTGITARPLAQAVSPGGHVTGIDISAPMLAVAREHGGAITYLQEDAQTYDFGAPKFDAAISRFGVMFFADPVAAFTNLRAALGPDGRLAFVCWAPLADNPHWQIPFDVVRARLGEPEPRLPHTPGPLAFSDSAYLERILTKAGFASISITPVPVPIIGKSLEDEAEIACYIGPAGALLDEKNATPETRLAVRHEIAAAISHWRTDTGMSLPATVFAVTAAR